MHLEATHSNPAAHVQRSPSTDLTWHSPQDDDAPLPRSAERGLLWPDAKSDGLVRDANPERKKIILNGERARARTQAGGF